MPTETEKEIFVITTKSGEELVRASSPAKALHSVATVRKAKVADMEKLLPQGVREAE